uniref:Putative ovule protein n=1 Tax=Solanum chacoense TaxID=4108 RepID=A0A0V0GL19_SOLCH
MNIISILIIFKCSLSSESSLSSVDSSDPFTEYSRSSESDGSVFGAVGFDVKGIFEVVFRDTFTPLKATSPTSLYSMFSLALFSVVPTLLKSCTRFLFRHVDIYFQNNPILQTITHC